MDNNRSKRIIERMWYIVPIAIVFGFFVHVWWSNAPPTQAAIGLTLALIVLITTFGALVTKEIGARGFWIIKKQEKPTLFWIEFVIQIFLGLFFLTYVF